MADISAVPSLTGTLTAGGTISGALSGNKTLSGELTVPAIISPDIYDEEYEVTPEVYNEVVLNTMNKLLVQNVTVHKVPYYETTNESGGYTAIIG